MVASARVSNGKDAMLHSLAAPITYYQNLITSHQGWKFAGVYADEAFTGTKDNRHEFQRLIQDCKDGKRKSLQDRQSNKDASLYRSNVTGR